MLPFFIGGTMSDGIPELNDMLFEVAATGNFVVGVKEYNAGDKVMLTESQFSELAHLVEVNDPLASPRAMREPPAAPAAPTAPVVDTATPQP
jgi:hypothetical protein